MLAFKIQPVDLERSMRIFNASLTVLVVRLPEICPPEIDAVTGREARILPLMMV